MDPQKLKDSILQRAVSSGYNPNVEDLRTTEYPQLKDITYLDHAGTTLYATSLIHSFSTDLCTNLYGNPHSPSPSSQQTTKRIDDIRLRVLRLFNASPEDFDVVFCANATAGMKLVLEAFTAQPAGFRYRYHGDAHTSLIGIRELATEATCYASDAEVELWLRSPCDDDGGVGLFGWPAQSNFTGRRLPRDWAGRVRKAQSGWYSLLDAAALVTTSVLDLGDVETAPDFTVLSFYKMFGFPDLGALIVRKESAGILRTRRYFGGGTVDAVVGCRGGFHARKEDAPHSHLEDGTSAFHSILALDAAISTHGRLYGDYENISRHAFSLAAILHEFLSNLKHGNGRKLCQIYSTSDYKSPLKQGPIIAFNMQRADGTWVGYAEVEKLASVKNIHLRTGSLCNPGGIEQHVGLAAWEIEQNYRAGHRCWDDQDVMRGKPTGAIRISLGAMSTLADLSTLLSFLSEFYIDSAPVPAITPPIARNPPSSASLTVESLTIYPIKSCGGYSIPPATPWELLPHGLAWDREWCLIHLGTGAAIDQKRYNRMALIRPAVDLSTGTLTVSIHNTPEAPPPLSIPLLCTPEDLDNLHPSASRVCGDRITTLTYAQKHIIDFFTAAVGVPCTLARFPAAGGQRHFKSHLAGAGAGAEAAPIGLSNESPVLLINRASVDALNEDILCSGGKPARAAVFRANIVVRGAGVGAYAEDRWRHVRIGGEFFEMLGACRRCHMVCVDQETAVRDEEPYVTLAKRRGVGGRVVFGVHARHLPIDGGEGVKVGVPVVRVGDGVRVWEGGGE